MSRTHLAWMTDTILFTGIGVVFGLTWWLVAGTADMPYWAALLFIAATEVAARAVSAVSGYVKARRHPSRRAHARPAPSKTGGAG